MHATFDRLSATSRWTISASALKDFSEHFGPKTEQLDIYPEGGRCIFNSYTEKIMNGRGVSALLISERSDSKTALTCL